MGDLALQAPMDWHTWVGLRLSLTRPLMMSGRLDSIREMQRSFSEASIMPRASQS